LYRKEKERIKGDREREYSARKDVILIDQEIGSSFRAERMLLVLLLVLEEEKKRGDFYFFFLSSFYR
jgi:hypothetical protein